MSLPLYISVPHAGTDVVPELLHLAALSPEEILAERDTGADAIYFPLREQAAGFLTTDIARVMVDLNRAPGDIGGNGVIKSHTCMNVPVFRDFPDPELIRDILTSYYYPYHEKLSAGARISSVQLGIDCHTMSATGPPVGPDPGRARPLVCLSNGGNTCPEPWLEIMAACFAGVFGEPVAINTPFRGGYIIRAHAGEMPWLQLEISQTAAFSDDFKSDCVLEGLQTFCHTVF